VRKRYSPVGWYVWGFLFPVAAYLFLSWKAPAQGAMEAPAGLAKVPLTREPVACRACGYANHPAAEQCLGCGRTIEPHVQSEVTVVRRS
jgi:hypothetical protein